MRVLLDERLPHQLGRELVGHEVSTVQGEGWFGVRNGELLARAGERGFEVFITKDQADQGMGGSATVELENDWERARAGEALERIEPLQ